MIFENEKVNGFFCFEPEIRIEGLNGKTLYYFKNPERKKVCFNLIVGKWKTENKIEKLPKPIIYKTPKLEVPTVKREIKPFRLFVCQNPNKCTIDFSGKYFADVFIDYEIANQSIPFFTFVMFHENGHFFYGDSKNDKEYLSNEHKCDCYAAKNMLEYGFNPSQCLFAVEMCLSESLMSRKRKDLIFDWLKKCKRV